MRERSPLFARLRLMLAQLLRLEDDLPPGGPADPYARVRVPRPGGLPGLLTSVALTEPDDEPEFVTAVGASARR